MPSAIRWGLIMLAFTLHATYVLSKQIMCMKIYKQNDRLVWLKKKKNYVAVLLMDIRDLLLSIKLSFNVLYWCNNLEGVIIFIFFWVLVYIICSSFVTNPIIGRVIKTYCDMENVYISSYNTFCLWQVSVQFYSCFRIFYFLWIIS